MNRNDLRSKIQNGFLEAAPDVYESVLKAAEKSKQMPGDAESYKTEEYADAGRWHNSCKSHGRIRKGSVLWREGSKYALSACAGFVVFFICLLGILGEDQERIYIVLDINPSIQIFIDESCHVEKLQGLNQDGKDVIRALGWKKKETLSSVIDTLVENTAQGSYLQEDGGILVTICAKDGNLYNKLESELGSGIDRKLELMGMSDVITAFQRIDSRTEKVGREFLESELADIYGIEAGELHEMSVMELLEYCQEHAGKKLVYSPSSEKKRQESSEKKDREQDDAKSLEEKKKTVSGESKEKENTDKRTSDSGSKEDDAENRKPREQKYDSKSGQDSNLKDNSGNRNNSGNGNIDKNKGNGKNGNNSSKDKNKGSGKKENNGSKDKNKGSGNSGNNGSPGNNGNNGSPGNSGNNGSPGNSGNNGNPGNNGNNGNPGNNGDNGSPGNSGNNGSPGNNGDNGSPGNNGDNGSPGNNGDNGSPGNNGDNGSPGNNGDNGSPGNNGDNGSPDNNGSKDDKGNGHAAQTEP